MKAGGGMPTALEPPASVLERNLAREDTAREDARGSADDALPVERDAREVGNHPALRESEVSNTEPWTLNHAP